MAVLRLTASWIVRLWLGLLAWFGIPSVRPTIQVPTVPSTALVPARSVALVCLPKHTTALVRCPLQAMALIRYVVPSYRTYKAAPVTLIAAEPQVVESPRETHLSVFGIRERRMARHISRGM